LAAIFANNARLVQRHYNLIEDFPIGRIPEAESAVSAIYNKVFTEKQMAVFLYICMFSLIHSMNALPYPLSLYEQQQYGNNHDLAVRHFISDICDIFLAVANDRRLFDPEWTAIDIAVQHTILQAVFFIKDYYTAGNPLDRVNLCAPETSEAEEEMNTVKRYLELCFILLGKCQLALSNKPKLDTPSFVIPFVNDCFSRVPRKVEIIPILSNVLKLLEVCSTDTNTDKYIISHVQ